MRPERLYLSDILGASKNVTLHIGKKSRDEFIADRTASAAVLHELAVIGEAVARIPVTLRERCPSIPWPDIAAFRNLIVHEYFGLSWPLIRDTARNDVPVLQREVAAILRSEFPDSVGSS